MVSDTTLDVNQYISIFGIIILVWISVSWFAVWFMAYLISCCALCPFGQYLALLLLTQECSKTIRSMQLLLMHRIRASPCHQQLCYWQHMISWSSPDNKVHGANMGPTWVLLDPGWSHVGPMCLVIRVIFRWQEPWLAMLSQCWAMI